jgi:hypothetical protein
MSLDELSQAFHLLCFEVRSVFSPEAVAGRLQCEADWLRDRLRRHYDVLMQQRREIETLVGRVARNEKQITAQKYRIETFLQVGDRKKAYRQALELDQLRQELDEARSRLRRRKHEHLEQVAAIRRLERRRDTVEAQLRALESRAAKVDV